MARRKQVPEVARPGRRIRLIELGKDLLIGVLACSAVLLAAQTSLVTGLRGWITEPTQAGEPVIRQPEEAVMPYLAAVRSEWGVYGAIYDKEAVDRTVTSLRPILGEGLNTAGAVEEITERRWRALLGVAGGLLRLPGKPAPGSAVGLAGRRRRPVRERRGPFAGVGRIGSLAVLER